MEKKKKGFRTAKAAAHAAHVRGLSALFQSGQECGPIMLSDGSWAFWTAHDVFGGIEADNSPLVLETDDAEFEFEQGALRLLMFNHYYSRFPTWASGRPFFAHRLVDDDAPANPDDPKLDLAPVAIMHGGELKLVLRVPEGKGRMITSPNHESIELPRRQGLWLALHPFPKRKGREEGPRD